MAGTILLGHGSGGRLTHELFTRVFLPAFDDPELARETDGAVVAAPDAEIVVSTDAFVVDPIFFPGGDIGSLAVSGSVNDVAVMGARPLYLTLGFILEEGLPIADLERICRSVRDTARAAGVRIVAGDTKVVPRGRGDKIFITSTALGSLPPGRRIDPTRSAPGDAVLVSGTLGDHGMAVLAARGDLGLELDLVSDAAPVHELVEALFAAGVTPHALRDPTRGGLAGVLHELARAARVAMEIEEAAIPVRPATASACELLGLDPLYVANEGKLVAVVPASQAESALAAWRAHPLGREAARIGEVLRDGKPGTALLRTVIGGRRVLPVLTGDQLPRIC